MDYSLLCGIHYFNRDSDKESQLKNNNENENINHSPFFQKDFGGIISTNNEGKLGDELYYFGIIDILVKFGTKKKLENIGKSLLYNSVKFFFTIYLFF